MELANLKNIFVINLDKREDRLAQFDSEAKRVGFSYTRFPAIESKRMTGAQGCTKSHLELCKMAKKNNLRYYIVLEDD
jgi:GR25 family glycosyltransferase involved in LPS biosynthesis